ncbi:DUF4097 family beta strand repeat-containing protein [Pseudolysinimonas sp.]|uniref:DUF4097 family beta strand repeat-containing protein n=1 Tax=Pseudolysinimonas sp. TaxID=2680009 RepID=UPI003F7DE3C4
MPAFAVTAPVDADLEVSIGSLDIVASDRADVVAELLPTHPGRAGDESLARESTVSFDGGRLRVRVPRRITLFGQSDSVDVRVELPTGSRVVAQNNYGSLRLRGALGASRLTAKYGNVTADEVGDLVLSTPYGTAEITAVTGTLDVTAGHGHVRIGRVAGSARLRGAHGTIELGEAGGAVDASTSGPLTIDRTLADVTARSAHGAIRIRSAEGGVLQLENGYAEIEVGVPGGVAAWVDAASKHGAVRNELTPDPAAASTDRTVELHLQTDWSDVIIRRA